MLFHLFVCGLFLAAGATASAQAGLSGIGDLSGGSFESRVVAVSADGLTVVGSSKSASGWEPVVWTQEAGIKSLGLGSFLFPFAEANAIDASADASIIVGSGLLSIIPGTWGLFRSIDQGSLQPLGDLHATLRGMSADGTVMVGMNETPLGYEAFRWTESGGMQGLGDLAGGSFSSTAYAASANGDVIVGDGWSASGQEPFRWTSGGGMIGLGRLPGDTAGFASAVSADGSVVVGMTNLHPISSQAFRWTSAGGMVGLGDLPGGTFWSVANAVSADGDVVFGYSIGASGAAEPFIWDALNGMRKLEDVLENEHGLELAGWTLWTVSGVSADGRTIVGDGRNPDGFAEGWVARLPAPQAVPALSSPALAAAIALLLLAGAQRLGSRPQP